MGNHVNIDEIVSHSGVSRSTVFRFLRGSNVREGAKTAIIGAMQSLGYADDRLVGKSTGLELEISTAEYMENFLGFTQAISGVTDAADRFGIPVRIVKRSGTALQSAYDKGFDRSKGVIVIGKNLSDEEAEAKLLAGHNIPHAFINRTFSDPDVSFVSVDLVRAGYDITQYLIEMGYKNIAIIGDIGSMRPDREKIQGYKMAMIQNDIKVSEELCVTGAKKESIEQYLTGYFKNGKKPDAFVGICDTYAMKFIAVAEQHGYSVPEDIAVVGMDDVASGEFFRPALTTVHVPFYDLGYLAVDAIVKQFQRGVRTSRILVRHKIIKRQSSEKTT